MFSGSSSKSPLAVVRCRGWSMRRRDSDRVRDRLVGRRAGMRSGLERRQPAALITS
jgi:hypothetical protein